MSAIYSRPDASRGQTTNGAPARRVLIVDDDPDILEFVSIALEDEGYNVASAPHGAAALERLNAGTATPDVILLDMRMPVMDGWEFARVYRQAPGPHAPIIVLTAAQDAAERAAQINAQAFLGKPFEIDELLNSIERVAGAA
jgi:CheY-like chemotaxis protein